MIGLSHLSLKIFNVHTKNYAINNINANQPLTVNTYTKKPPKIGDFLLLS